MSFTTSSGRRIPLAPAEGWVTVGLVLALCLSFAWALDDALLARTVAFYIASPANPQG